MVIGAGLDAGAAVSVWDRSLPDLDQRLGAVLDLASGVLAPAPRPASFAHVDEYKAALARLGDLAYEDAQGGMLFVASGFALPLGADAPGPDALRGLDRRLEARTFLRGSELEPGAWFAVRTRSGTLSVARVMARTGTALRLAWSPPQSATERLRMEWIDAIAALRPPQIEKALLPSLGTTPESVLRLADGKFGAGPPLPEPLSAQALGALVEAVGPVGDLAYFHRRSGRLVVASGKVARLGTGPVAVLAGRDLRDRLRERPLVSADALTPGSVMLVETTDGHHALVRIDASEPEGLSLTWLYQPDGTAVFADLAAFDASFEIPDQRELDRLLLAAAARGDASELRRLLEMGADANTSLGREGRPALVHAVIGGDPDTVALLLEAGADPAGTGGSGWSALHAAAQLGRAELAEALISAGADLQASTPDGRDALQIALSSPRANLDLIRLVRRESKDPDSLALAARVGDLAALTEMLEDGANVNVPDVRGQSALYVAAASGQEEAIRTLLNAGADPGLEFEGEGSALVAAASAGHTRVTAALIEHGGNTLAQKTGALHAANVRGDPELVRILLAAGAAAELDTGQGLTPLAFALQYGSGDLVDVYVAEGHETTVASAARLGRIESLTTLLSNGADPRQATPDGRSPLQHAIQNDQPEALRVLLDHGVAADAPLATWDRRSPLHEAAKHANTDVLALLLDRGADPNRLDRVGRSPLYDAVAHGREESVRLLLDRGADPTHAPAGEALIDIARKDSIREMLERHGARSAELPVRQ
ncbi:MAG: ankyrin repeat domain-containing protein [Myxococcales bacterium]|nr:ankyrin repeat domain-containing protein [Myxococcales bacterium]